MGPELGLVLLVTLLWGPTAVWLVYRAVRGHEGRYQGLTTHAPDETLAPPIDPRGTDPLVELGFWICAACKSLNREGAMRCYACRARADVAGPAIATTAPGTSQRAPHADPMGDPGAPASNPAPARAPEFGAPAAPPTPWLQPPVATPAPLRGAPVARATPPMDRPVAPAVPSVTATDRATPLPPPPPAVRVTLPVHPPAPAAGWAATIAPVATPVDAVPGPPARILEARAGLSVCPFLGTRDEPSTWFDFPTAGNLCHATSGGTPPSSTPLAALRRLISGSTASDPVLVPLDHQRAFCLAAVYEQCSRFPAGATPPAARVVAAAAPSSAVAAGPEPLAPEAAPASAPATARRQRRRAQAGRAGQADRAPAATTDGGVRELGVPVRPGAGSRNGHGPDPAEEAVARRAAHPERTSQRSDEPATGRADASRRARRATAPMADSAPAAPDRQQAAPAGPSPSPGSPPAWPGGEHAGLGGEPTDRSGSRPDAQVVREPARRRGQGRRRASSPRVQAARADGGSTAPVDGVEPGAEK